MVAESKTIENYFYNLNLNFNSAYNLAQIARSKGYDPTNSIEISPAFDVAARVEGLTGPVGVAVRIRKLVKNLNREAASFQIAKEIMLSYNWKESANYSEEQKTDLESRFYDSPVSEKQIKLEQAVRTGLALFTEGVVSAPIEGISKIQIRPNSDGTFYSSVYFSGPIRGAGGTGQAFALLLTDYCKTVAKLSNYQASQSHIDRYVEELALYARKTRVGQYLASEEEVKHIMLHCPVCIDGDSTEDYEIQKHKNIPEFPSNRVRGGMCLVLSEGVCLKAAKIIKIAKKAGLDWSWLEKLVKNVKSDSKIVQIKPVSKFMDEIVAGRPIFSFPMTKGGFRLRYGRTPYTGIASKAVNPATMEILGEFPAIGTQVKVERPGKGCILTPCQSIMGPIVRLTTGEVLYVDTVEKAIELREQIEKILFLGDLLVNYGDFLKSNHPLVPSGYVEEWYMRDLENAGVSLDLNSVNSMSLEEAIKLSKEKGIPLAPKFTYFWQDIPTPTLLLLVESIKKSKFKLDWFEVEEMQVENTLQNKEIFEDLLITHKLDFSNNRLVFLKTDSILLLTCLGLKISEGGKIDSSVFDQCYSEQKSVFQIIKDCSGLEVKPKVGIYIGSSMGRPEKAKPRKMKPPVNSLFPIGKNGGKFRSIVKASNSNDSGITNKLEIELGFRACTNCNLITWKSLCPTCNEITTEVKKCTKCSNFFPANSQLCKCGSTGVLFDLQAINFESEYKNACSKVNFKPTEVKGVTGLISSTKTPEPLEKGILRSKHGIWTFRDGTARFDATEIPATHFCIADIGTDFTRLIDLGYVNDIYGKPIANNLQWVELFPQDIVVSESAVEFLISDCNFIDDELVYLYGQSPYYQVKNKDQLIGVQVICLAPHTSAGVLARVIGFSPIQGLIAHPYLHCATRRNADGDELAFMLLLDGLLNFSKFYLPETRGGRMDAPLVLTVKIDPSEVDDEAHALDVVWNYPSSFYLATQINSNPSEVKIETVLDRLKTKEQFEGIGFTHYARLQGPTKSTYVKFGNMVEKVKSELSLMKKIRAVDVSFAAQKIIQSHFFPDLYGNLRSFSKQTFRCVDCGFKWRRVPLKGKCSECGGKLLLTINKGGIEKYLKISKEMVETYNLPPYLNQRLMLIEKEISSVFEDDTSKQFDLSEYV